jgi:hypothetical protein
MSLGPSRRAVPTGPVVHRHFLMVQSEAYASRERPAIFSLDCDRQSRERNLLMNNVHFMNEFYSSELFHNPFYGDDG